ncbi:MAG TPA: hypothetical protein VEJ63_01110 [Planctomycetota bacterium]|nr:hypothetical protein [Planctomycetota bacterium]
MKELKTDNYGPLTKELLAKAWAEGRPRSLKFGPPAADAQTLLQGMTDQNISSNRRVRMPHDAAALQSALWLLFDFFEDSHNISQNIATPSGSYWHGILHRREPDAGNAKYWMARVGEHPIFPDMLSDAKEIAAKAGPSGAGVLKQLEAMATWDASWFVEQCTGGNEQMTLLLLELQRREWQLLFDYNFSKAFA